MDFEKHITLTYDEEYLCLKADAEYDNKPQSRRTRLYSVCRNRRGNDIEFIMVAVRHIRGERRFKPVAVTSVDSRVTVFSGESNIICTYGPAPAMLKIGWKELDLDKNGKQKEYAAYGRMWWYDQKSAVRSWITHDFDKRGKDETRYWLWWRKPLNYDEIIADNPRFKYSAYAGSVTTLEWLRRYAAAHEIENFAKLGVSYLATIPFVNKLRKDKGFFRFFRDNLNTIKDARWCIGVSAIEHAYRHGLTFAAELEYRENLKRIRRLKSELTFTTEDLPRDFDYSAAVDFLNHARVSPWEYRRYLNYCIEAGADLTSPHTAFPHNIERRLHDFDMAVKRKERKAKKEREKALKQLAEAYAKACSCLKAKGYVFVFPTSAADFVREGKAMNNCIGGGSYTIRHADKECVCVFIRLADAPEKPFVDVEIVGGKVKQCYTANNQTADKSVRKYAEKIAKAVYRKAA